MNDLRDERGMTARELSDRSGISYDNILKYKAGSVENPRGSTLKAIAEALDCTEEYLRFGNAQRFSPPLQGEGIKILPVRMIPKIKLSEVYMALSLPNGFKNSDYPQIAIADVGGVSENAVAVEITDGSMERSDSNQSFSKYDLAIVDLTISPEPGDLVLAIVNEEAMLRRFRLRSVDKDGNSRIDLIPLNGNYPIVEIDGPKQDYIYGKVVQKVSAVY